MAKSLKKPPATLAVGVVQLNSGQDMPHNLKNAAKWVAECARRGAQVVVLPEIFAWRGNMAEELKIVQPLRGRIYKALQAMARQQGVALVGGSFLENPVHPKAPQRAFNTMVALDENGVEQGLYRKLHLFDINRPGAVTLMESHTRERGMAPAMATLGGVPVGLAICYDLRFPELFRHYALSGALGFVVGAAFTTPTGKDHWHLLLRARAVENQCFMAAANQFGAKGGGANYGHSAVVDAWGNVLADVGEGEGCAVAWVDLKAQAALRRDFPVLEHLHDQWREGLLARPV